MLGVAGFIKTVVIMSPGHFTWTLNSLASFQGHPSSRLWLLAVCKYRGGKPGRSGHVQWYQVERCHRHTRGSAWRRMLKPFLVMSIWVLGGHSVHNSASIPSIVCNTRDKGLASTKQELLLSASAPCLWLHATRSPRHSPSIFAQCKKNPRLEVGTTWEGGYC